MSGKIFQRNSEMEYDNASNKPAHSKKTRIPFRGGMNLFCNKSTGKVRLTPCLDMATIPAKLGHLTELDRFRSSSEDITAHVELLLISQNAVETSKLIV
jgi:hypothetical protein